MKITDEAKLLITEALVANDCDCLQVTSERSCCGGTNFNFAPIKMTPDKNSDCINGICIQMDNRVRAMTETITLAARDGELIIQNDKPSCCC
jgi:hypothetical protein